MPGHAGRAGMSQPLRYIPRPFPPPVATRLILPPASPQPFPVYLSTDSFLGLLFQRSTGRGEKKKYPKGGWRGCIQAKAGNGAAPSRGCPLPGAASPRAAAPSRTALPRDAESPGNCTQENRPLRAGEKQDASGMLKARVLQTTSPRVRRHPTGDSISQPRQWTRAAFRAEIGMGETSGVLSPPLPVRKKKP